MTKVNNKINAIGEYSLFRKLIDGQFSGSYNLGIYSDKFGKKYFIKSYTGSKNDSEYRWLANESKIYSIINQNKGYSGFERNIPPLTEIPK